MKKIAAPILLALPLLAGCVSSNSAEGRKSEAYARCSYTPGPKERAACIKTELALLEARDRAEDQRIQDDRAAAEQRQAVLEASGVPRDKAEQTVDTGLQPPN